jgi:hypothetical protein
MGFNSAFKGLTKLINATHKTLLLGVAHIQSTASKTTQTNKQTNKLKITIYTANTIR